MSGSEPIKQLFITLKRSFAGTSAKQKAVLKALGFSYRLQTVEKPNNVHIRGTLNKVKHLVAVETDGARLVRLEEEAKKRQPLPYLVLKHS